MAKKNNREVTVLGMVNIPRRGAVKVRSGRELLAEAMAGTTGLERAAAQADADARAALERQDEIRERGLYAGSGADPGSIIGLDGFTPSGETAGDGDDPRTTEPTDPS